MSKKLSKEELDNVVNSFWELIEKSKSEEAQAENPFIRLNNGVLEIDLDELNEMNADEEEVAVLQILNLLAKQ